MVVELTLACTEYDWTRPLWDGTVEPEGIDLHVVDYHNPERFARMIEYGAFDVCEMSLGSYLAARATEAECPFTAIPVFPYRRFRHSFIYRRATDEFTLSELNDKTVGLIHWQTTTGIWQRGIAREHYGVDLETVTWHTTKSEGDVVSIEIPDRYDVVHDHRAGSTSELFASMLQRGEIDAAFSTAPLTPRVADGRHDDPGRLQEPNVDGVERIFEDAMQVEQEYYRETNIFPPMHTVVISDEVLDAYPWVANKLYDAFDRALQICMDRLTKPRWFPLAWANQHLEHQRDVLGENPWAYGLTDETRTALTTLQEYAANQGIIAEPDDIDDLFVDATLR